MSTANKAGDKEKFEKLVLQPKDNLDQYLVAKMQFDLETAFATKV